MPMLAVNRCWNKYVTFDNNKNYAQFIWGHKNNDEWIQPMHTVHYDNTYDALYI